MRGEKIIDFLEKNSVPYEIIKHPIAYSAQMTAHAAHVPGREMAKTVIVKINGKLTMVVTTANQKVNMRLLKNVFYTDDVELANESDFMDTFSDCELGAMPPFGNLYGMDEIVSEELAKDYEITFNAGTHTDLIKMKYKDFEKLVKPVVLNFKIKL
jgi:Ala-tRNA(Pro) deacylase